MMRRLVRVSGLTLFALLSVFLILFGLLYATVGDILPFHAAAVPEASREAVKPLYFALMKLIGAASAGLGVLGLYSVFIPMRNRQVFASSVVSVIYVGVFLAAAAVAETLAATTGAPTSWHIMGFLIVITIMAWSAMAAERRFS